MIDRNNLGNVPLYDRREAEGLIAGFAVTLATGGCSLEPLPTKKRKIEQSEADAIGRKIAHSLRETPPVKAALKDAGVGKKALCTVSESLLQQTLARAVKERKLSLDEEELFAYNISHVNVEIENKSEKKAYMKFMFMSGSKKSGTVTLTLERP